MKNRQFRNILIFAGVSSLLALTGCSSLDAGASHRPIVDGGNLANYEADLAQCQQVAQQRGYLNDETKEDALIGAAIGGLIGQGGNTEDIVGGLVAGAALGAADGTIDARSERKNIVINCMRNRGYNTVESLAVHE